MAVARLTLVEDDLLSALTSNERETLHDLARACGGGHHDFV
jgi:hypothetical protein